MKKLNKIIKLKDNVTNPQKKGFALHLDQLNTVTVEEHFDITHITSTMTEVTRAVLGRLDGDTSQPPIVKLKQSMGGGKTHTQLTVAYLAKSPGLVSKYMPEIEVINKKGTNPVIINGRNNFENGIWTDIANQLGLGHIFEPLLKHGLTAPGESDWKKLFQEAQGKVLIILDELPPYLAGAAAKPIGGTTLAALTITALSNLFTAAASVNNVSILLSDLDGEYEETPDFKAKTLTEKQKDAGKNAANIINKESSRQHIMELTPVKLDSNDIFLILKKRFIDLIDPEEYESYIQELQKFMLKKHQDLTLGCGYGDERGKKYLENLQDTYPFHPSWKELLSKVSKNTGYQQTRGAISLMQALLCNLNKKEKLSEVTLVGPEHLDFTDPSIYTQITNINDSLDQAIAFDFGQSHKNADQSISSLANVKDIAPYKDIILAMGTTLLFSSLSENSTFKGLNKCDIGNTLVLEPERDTSLYPDAHKKLHQLSRYINNDEDKNYFENHENITALIENKSREYVAAKTSLKKINSLLENWLKPNSKAEVISHFICRLKEKDSKIEAIDLDELDGFVLVALDPSQNIEEQAKKLYLTGRKNKILMLAPTNGPSNVHIKLNYLAGKLLAIENIIENNEKLTQSQKHVLDQRFESTQHELYNTAINMYGSIHYTAANPFTQEIGIKSVTIDWKQNIDYTTKLSKEYLLGNVIEALKTQHKVPSDIGEVIESIERFCFTERSIKTESKSHIIDTIYSNIKMPLITKALLEEAINIQTSNGDWRIEGTNIEIGPFQNLPLRLRVTNQVIENNEVFIDFEVNSPNKINLHNNLVKTIITYDDGQTEEYEGKVNQYVKLKNNSCTLKSIYIGDQTNIPDSEIIKFKTKIESKPKVDIESNIVNINTPLDIPVYYTKDGTNPSDPDNVSRVKQDSNNPIPITEDTKIIRIVSSTENVEFKPVEITVDKEKSNTVDPDQPNVYHYNIVGEDHHKVNKIIQILENSKITKCENVEISLFSKSFNTLSKIEVEQVNIENIKYWLNHAIEYADDKSEDKSLRKISIENIYFPNLECWKTFIQLIEEDEDKEMKNISNY